MKKLMYLILLLPFVAEAKTSNSIDSLNKGIKFENGQTWEQIKARAKSENKLIFIDFFATWCGPCKAMDNEVYTDDKIGAYFNLHFICIKAQVDTSANDNAEVKSWYKTVSNFKEKYKISAFPTLMFFSSNGEALHKGLGYKSPDELMALAKDALNPEKQYFTLLNNYENGERNYPAIRYLAITAKSFDNKTEKNLSDSLAKDYINHYLIHLGEDELYDKNNILFMADFTKSTNDKSFSFFYKNGNKIDQILGVRGYSFSITQALIYREEIAPSLTSAINKDSEPNWDKLAFTIRKKYGTLYVMPNILYGKFQLYHAEKKWPLYCKNALLYIRRTILNKPLSASSAWMTNDLIYDAIVVHSNRKNELDEASIIMRRIVEPTSSFKNVPEYIDTYASLLYKYGKVREAIIWEKRAVILSKSDPNIKNNYNKMLKGKAIVFS